MKKERKKKVNKKNIAELNETGVLIENVGEGQKSGLVFVCLMKALMISLVTCGTVVGFCDAFSLPYNTSLIVGFTIVISVVMSLLYINKKVFFIGYTVILILYIVEIIRYYLYANSGFQAIVNTVREAYADRFNMDYVKTAEEFYENRYVTITIALIFILVFLVILFNITISRYMNMAETFFIAFFILEFALYIDYKPKIFYMMLVLAGCIGTGILQRGAWVRTVITSDSSQKYSFDRFLKIKYFTTRGEAKSLFTIIYFSFLFSACVCLFSVRIFKQPAGEAEENSIKSEIDGYIQIFVRDGLGGLFDRYNSTNGLQRGRLGGVSTVSPDFKTDLVVSFVPSGSETLYMPGYRAESYNGENWFQFWVNSDDPQKIHQYVDNVYEKYIDRFPKGSMEITYFDRWLPGVRPYITLESDEIVRVDDPQYKHAADESGEPISGEGLTDCVSYVPLQYLDYYNGYDEADIMKLSDGFQGYISEECLSVPENLRDYFRLFFKDHQELKQYRMKKKQLSQAEDNAAGDNSIINSQRLAACDALAKMFLKEYPYTLSPGKTPSREDFIQYFLSEQKRGYCAHFASAAVMLLRYMGVPARYVEGYCIPASLVKENGRQLKDVPEGWTSDNGIFGGSAVTVEVSDYYAHAWVEVYLEGVGFVPYEFTPPSFEVIGQGGGLLGLGNFFQRLLNVDLGLGDISNGTLDFTGENVKVVKTVEKTNPVKVFVPVIIVLVSGAMIWVCYLLIRLLIRRIKMKKMLVSEDYAGLIYILYYELAGFLYKKKLIQEKNPLPMDLATRLREAGLASAVAAEYTAEAEKMFRYAERVLYSGDKGTREEYDAFYEWMDKVKKSLNKKSN